MLVKVLVYGPLALQICHRGSCTTTAVASNGTVLNHCSSWDAQSTYHQQLYFQKLATLDSSSGELNVKGQVHSVIRDLEKVCVWA